MACLIVPMAQGIATTIFRRQAKRNHISNAYIDQLPKLETMLYGGTAMLIVDHVINGEIVPFFPFFTALETEGGAMVMLREMLTVGVPMSIVVTLIWLAMVALQKKQA